MTSEDLSEQTAAEAAVVPEDRARQGLERTLDWAPRIALYAVLGTATAVPAAALLGAYETHLEDSLASTPVTIRLEPSDHTRITALPSENLYLPLSKLGWGVSVQINDLPGDSLSDIVSTETAQQFAGLYENPHQTVSGVQKTLASEALQNTKENLRWMAPTAFATLFMIRFAGAKDRPKRQIDRESSQAAAGGGDEPEQGSEESRQAPAERPKRRVRRFATAIAAGALSVGAVAGGLTAWERSTPQPDGTHFTIDSLDGTSLEGAFTDNTKVAQATNDFVPRVRVYAERVSQERIAFEHAIEQQLAEKAGEMAMPTENEFVVAVGSDLHVNHAMTKLIRETIAQFNQRAGDNGVKFVYMAGDLGYDRASDFDTIQEEGKLGDGAQVYTVAGNHDGSIALTQIEASDIKIVDGHVTDPTTDMILSGAIDPNVTPNLGSTMLRDGTTEEQVGQAQYEADKAERAGITELHEGYAALAYMGLEAQPSKTVKDFLTNWFAQRGSNTVAWEDGIRDLPTSLLVYGHWHRIIQPRVVYNSDGSHTLVMELNTMGGAVADPSLNRYSLPEGAPVQTASFAFIYMDKTTHQVTGYQMIFYHPDGVLEIQSRVAVGSQATAAGRPGRTTGQADAARRNTKADKPN